MEEGEREERRRCHTISSKASSEEHTISYYGRKFHGFTAIDIETLAGPYMGHKVASTVYYKPKTRFTIIM